ncbi:MAG: response regulator [Elusimicrobia bacterium]|nr:response regulator [Elusimicrobiota bacterium]
MAAILLIDDDQVVRDMLAEALTAAGHEVRLARDPAECRAVLAQRRPDLVISDIMMPGGGGAGVLAALEAAGLANLPLVVFSCVSDEQMRAVFPETPRRRYVLKTASPGELLKLVGSLLSGL